MTCPDCGRELLWLDGSRIYYCYKCKELYDSEFIAEVHGCTVVNVM